MALNRKHTRGVLLAATALVSALVLEASPAAAQEHHYDFDLPTQPLDSALRAFAGQSQQQLIFTDADTVGRTAPTLNGSYSAEEALQILLAGTDLQVRRSARGALVIAPAAAPQGGSADGGAEVNAVEALIVTAQKREEDIQDVPIAISAFSQRDLAEQKIEGGPDVMRGVPNMTFSKSNFSSYNISIRGIGTKAISATSDPGVAVAFNNAGMIHNRFFEQEFFDMERLEVLRGPQGTLYGRNATGGVVNLISAKPKLGGFEGSIKGEVGNYDSRRMNAMLNIPIAKDVLGVRVAGSMTDRDGYDVNLGTGNRVNGRDLWSLRTTVAFEPAPWFRANAIWERFSENDNRSRTGKQLCTKDSLPTHVGSKDLTKDVNGGNRGANYYVGESSFFQQGCLPGSLYDDAAFGVVSGYGISFVQAPLALSNLGLAIGNLPLFPGATLAGDHRLVSILDGGDPFANVTQSHNLREISSIRDPKYRARADLLQLNVEIDFSPALTFVSQTAYNEDKVYSFQDFLRSNSAPAFTDTSGLIRSVQGNNPIPSTIRDLMPGGVFCDPQIGCSDRVAIFDISQADSKQFSQEFRLQSDFDGPLNFSIGGNYTHFKTVNDYYVLSNLLTALAYSPPFYNDSRVTAFDPTICPGSNWALGGNVPQGDPTAVCPYVDPNPLDSINGEGHNYFRSKNPYKLRSYALFGEAYWNISDDVKLTAGLRYTNDRKTFTPVPSQTLLAPGLLGGGTVSRGYPELPDQVQSWGEFTGRFGIDWKPQLAFTDDTLIYGFYSRGYKGGGFNPPTPGFATKEEQEASARAAGIPDFTFDFVWNPNGYLPTLSLFANEYESTFKPEFVNAFEIGMKNTMLNGALTLNATAFHYDYTDYQVSQIRDRTAVNENFDAKVWGAELEARFAPTRNLRLNANVGYLKTKIGKGETSIDIMSRTQGNSDYLVVKPWIQLPSNCVLPVSVVEQVNFANVRPQILCPGYRGSVRLTSEKLIDPATGAEFDYANYPELNGGAGLLADLSGNELPNSPHWTVSLGAQYSWDLLDGAWQATVRGDAYWQSQSWHRVYNSDPYDKLHGWYNTNLSVWIEKPDSDLKIELYVKNVLDDTPITDAFLNSDDTGLTTNIFTLDPRLIGLSIRKGF